MRKILYKNKYLLAFLLLLSMFFIYWLVRELTYTRIKVEFENLRPFHTRAAVFYKGFEIGHVDSIKPANHYKTTIVTIAIHPLNTKLPINTEAKLKIHKTRWFHKDYIDLIYPDEPSPEFLKNGSVIKGTSSVDLNSYTSSISHETYEKMEKNIDNILENLDGSTGLLFSIFAIIQEVLQESQNDIKKTMANLQSTTYSSSKIVQKFDNSIKEEHLETSVSNFVDFSGGIRKSADEISAVIEQFNQNAPIISSIMCESNGIAKNLNEITCGIRKTLSKSFGGIRLLFGKSIGD